MAVSRIAASSTLRAIGPGVSWLCEIGTTWVRETRPTVGFSPDQRRRSTAGQVTEPSVSVPTAGRRQRGGDRRAGPGRRAAGAAVERVGVLHQPADARPAADRVGRADVGPFRQVGLAQDHRAGVLQPRAPPARRGAVTLSFSASEPAVVAVPSARLDIVLHQHRHAVQRPAQRGRRARSASIARGLGQGVRVERDHAAQRRARPVDRRDPRQIGPHQRLGRHRAGRHVGRQRRRSTPRPRRSRRLQDVRPWGGHRQ